MSSDGNSKTTAVFVDSVEEGLARLELGEQAFTVPAALLPDGAEEGTWLNLTATVLPPRRIPMPSAASSARTTPAAP